MSNPFGPFPSQQVGRTPKEPVVEKSKFMRDLMDLLRRHPFTAEELKEAFETLKGRMRHKTCTQCGKLTMEAEGKQYLGKELGATRFVCGPCFEKMP